MGCCISRPDGPNSPYPGGDPAASARAINVEPGGAAALGGAHAGGVLVAANSNGGNPAEEGAGGEGNASSATPVSSLASSPSTIGSSRQRTAAAPPVPASVPRLPPPQEALAAHINKPLRRRHWTSRSRVWTRHAIDRKRAEFFDTRVTGRAEIWQTLRTALEILWEADLLEASRRGGNSVAQQGASPALPILTTRSGSEPATAGAGVGATSAEAAEALATAQTILDAADITLPTGDMVQGAYDAFGNYYAMPAWIVSDPTNLDNDPEHDLEETKGMLDDAAEGSLSDDDSDTEEESVEGDTENDGGEDDVGNVVSVGERTADDAADHHSNQQTPEQQRHNRIRSRREKKGKAVVAAADQMPVRARLSITSRDVTIRIGREETVRSLAHRITEAAKLPHKTRIRIAYLGKILKESVPLTEQGWKEGHIVNALVFDTEA